MELNEFKKLKVGDKVKIKDDISECSCINDDMLRYQGKVREIVSINQTWSGKNFITFEDDGWYWYPDMIECKVEGFCKSDLKTGMLIEKRNGAKMLVLKDTEQGDILISEAHWSDLSSDYNNDLTSRIDSKFDIVKVYSLTLQCKAMPKNWDEYDEIIFERKPIVKKPTLTDAEKVILESLDKKWEYIARDKDGELYVYEGKPHRHTTSWSSDWDDEDDDMSLFEHLFSFIKWEDEEPYKIEDLIKGC